MLDHTLFDVTALRAIARGIMPEGPDVTACVAHRFHDATRARGRTPAIAQAIMAGAKHIGGQRALSAGGQAGGPSASVTFSVREPPDFDCQVTAMVSPG